jgi:hypothetical protein
MKSPNGGVTKGRLPNYATLVGNFKPMLAKYTKPFDLAELFSIGVDRIRGLATLTRED